MKAKGRNVRISDEVYDELMKNIPPLYKISKFVEIAILDKIEKERKTEKVVFNSLK
jgi:hypothetical protein